MSRRLYTRACRCLPGGVNSPVRAFGSVGGTPLFITRAKGPFLYDTEGRKYIDLVNAWGPILLGHAHPLIEEAIAQALAHGTAFGAPTVAEIEMAELICDMIPSVEQVRLVNSGTEATMSALRLARAYTGRQKFIKFRGNYHGHADPFLVDAGSGLAQQTLATSSGVPPGSIQDTLLADYNDIAQVQHLFELHAKNIAAIVVEPVAGNMGCVLPKPGFLQALKNLAEKHGALLIFDEVMTGFRLSAAGAQGLFHVTPHLTTLGKVIGGGLPVGAYGGAKELMKHVSPLGKMYQAGTLSGNPLAMAAGKATLQHLREHPDIYAQLETRTQQLVSQLKPHTCNHIGSMYSYFFTQQPVYDLNSAQQADQKRFARYFHHMLEQGIYLPPSPYESAFLSIAIENTHIERIAEAHHAFLASEEIERS